MEEKQYIDTQPVEETQDWGEQVSQVQTQVYHTPYADAIYDEPEIPVYPKKEKRVRKERTGKIGKKILCVVLAVLLVASSSVVTAVLMNRHWESRWNTMNVAMNDKYTALQKQIEGIAGSNGNYGGSVAPTGEWMTPGQVYAANVNAVVAVLSHIRSSDMFGQSADYESFGSGFMISEDGYIVSNYHVVEGATKISVETVAGDSYEAKLVGYDATNDLALLKVDAKNLPYVALGSSGNLAVGDQVVAIGNSLGELTSTLTVGYVSAKDRVVTTDGSAINMIQTDAAINSGNSGGPLFNMRGEVVGITTAKFSGTSSSGASIEGIGFAIPMDDVIGMIEDLQNLGYISGAYLGVMVRDVDTAAQSYGLPAGAYVEEVTPGYAAEAAGLRVQDIIIDLGGYEITSVTELTRMLRRFKPGETISITVYRAGQEVQLSITLDEKPRDVADEDAYLMPGDDGFEEWYKDFMDDYFG